MNKKPNKWVAATVGAVAAPLAMLYVAQPTWAAVYFVDLWMMSRQYTRTPWPFAVEVVLQLAICLGVAIHAYRLAVRYPADRPRPAYSRGPVVAGILIGWIALVAGFFYLLNWFVLELTPNRHGGI